MTVVATYLDSVKPQAVRWLWTGRMARGKLTVAQGDPGLGKTTVWLDVAARLTTGRCLPGESDAAEPMNVGIISDEDGLADTIVPRLEMAGADMSRICQLTGAAAYGKRSLMIPNDTGDIIEAIRSQNIGFLYIDPLAAHAGPGVKLNDDQDVRAQIMGPLAGIGEETGVGIVITRHPNKMVGASAMYRGGGSLGIIGAARFGLVFGRDPEDSDLQVLAPVKVNIGHMPPSLAYRLVGGERSDHARVEWEPGLCTLTADDIMDSAPKEMAKAKSSGERWLVAQLAPGPQKVSDLKTSATQASVGWRSVERAKANIGIEDQRVGFGKDSAVWWKLPGQTIPEPHTPPNGHMSEAVVSMAGYVTDRHTPPYTPNNERAGEDRWTR